jgi:hypothetical protein
MAEQQHGEPVWESTGVKLAVATVIILIFAVIFYLQIRPEPAASTYPAKPAAGSSQEPGQSAPDNSETSQPSYATDTPDTIYGAYPPDSPTSIPGQQLPAPSMPARTEIQNPPATSSSSPVTESRTFSTPISQVHSLSDAEEVMGTAAGEMGKVGVTQSFRLPDQNGGSTNQPLPKNGKQP